ncbi:hypothetical protein QJS66_14445 [Kocuria rhizophila]|nr:hypothetical protein QJS66_14445 [Kocuria rhizophila]
MTTSWSRHARGHGQHDVMLISRHGQSLRFRADDDALRPWVAPRWGVTGMKFR